MPLQSFVDTTITSTTIAVAARPAANTASASPATTLSTTASTAAAFTTTTYTTTTADASSLTTTAVVATTFAIANIASLAAARFTTGTAAFSSSSWSAAASSAVTPCDAFIISASFYAITIYTVFTPTTTASHTCGRRTTTLLSECSSRRCSAHRG
jgi:hypothetical protein